MLADLFGKRDGANYYAGLVDAESEEILDNDLKVLESRWERLAPGFHRWFIREQSSDFKKSMISLVRRKAGLAAPVETFTNNPNESLNSTIKKWQNYEKSHG